MSLIDSLKSFFVSNEEEAEEREPEGINDDLYANGSIRIVSSDENIDVLREQHAKKYRGEIARVSSTNGTPRASSSKLKELIKESRYDQTTR